MGAEARWHFCAPEEEEDLGPATKPRHEALKELSDYIVKFGQERTRPVSSIRTFADLWNAYRAVKSGQWSKSTNEIITCLFAKHVIPQLGDQRIEEITLTPLQLLVNSVAERGFSKSVVCKIRVYLKSCLEYAVDEDLLGKNPAKKIVLPKIRKKPCGRFLEVREFQALLAEAPPREHLVLRILGVCGLRAAETLVLRIEDFEGDQLRIDEALKDRMTGEDRIGDTKTDESDNFVPVPPDLRKEIETWIAEHPGRENPRAFLFPNARGRAFSVGNYLKRYLKPLGEQVGVHDLTHQTFRRTSSTHMQNHAIVKDMQRHLRHSDPQTTLKHYAKVIPASLRAAVAALDAEISGVSIKH